MHAPSPDTCISVFECTHTHKLKCVCKPHMSLSKIIPGRLSHSFASVRKWRGVTIGYDVWNTFEFWCVCVKKGYNWFFAGFSALCVVVCDFKLGQIECSKYQDIISRFTNGVNGFKMVTSLMRVTNSIAVPQKILIKYCI